jgi:hypothetical protein
MPSRPSLTSACCRRFAERKSLTFRQTLGAVGGAHSRKLRAGQSLLNKSIGLLGRFSVDALVFEFMGLAMIALCVIVLVVPSTRRPVGRQLRDF